MQPLMTSTTRHAWLIHGSCGDLGCSLLYIRNHTGLKDRVQRGTSMLKAEIMDHHESNGTGPLHT